MIIIGITGTLGAGKGTIVEILQKEYGFEHHSVRSYLTKVINERGLPVNRDSMVSVANELRANYAPSYIVEQLYEEAKKSTENCIIESLRAPGEVEALQQKGDFYLIAVDARPEVRYERIVGRGSETDKVSFEEFVSNEAREMHATDPFKQNIAACVKMADFVVDNNGNMQELKLKIDEIIKAINE